MNNRPSFQNIFMKVAELISKRATCKRGRHGAVIVKDNRIISIGYNGSPPGQPHCDDIGCLIDRKTSGCVRTLHAETNAIAQAAKYGISLIGSEIYITISPCLSCAKLIYSVGIVSCTFMELYRDDAGIDFLKKTGVKLFFNNHEEI